jgi:hypothetical protein
MFFLPSRLEQLSISTPRLLYVSFWGLTRPLFESVENINALCKARYVEDSVFGARVDSDLLDAGTHSRHPLPIVRLESLLHPSQLKAGASSRLRWKCSNLVERGTSQKSGLSTPDDYTNIDMSDQGSTPIVTPNDRLQRAALCAAAERGCV